MAQDNDTIRAEKLAKIEALRQLGYNPYPYSFELDAKIGDLLGEYAGQLKPGDHTDRTVRIAGRAMSVRVMGKVIFVDLKDESGQMQLFIREDELGEDFALAKLVDAGDVIGVQGQVGTTKTGELSLFVNQLEILTKSLTGLVDQYYGLKDIELRYRNRSLDLLTNPESLKTLRLRFVLMQKIREFMTSIGFLEVETPIVQTVYGGAAATPFKTHHEKLDMDMYLRVSPEQHLKRLLVGGFEAVYEMGKNFRNENIDRTHNPEFTMMEAYIAYQDYTYMMDMMERLFEYVLMGMFGTTTVMHEGQEISFARPWKRLTVIEALKTLADIDIDALSDDELFALAAKTNKELLRKVRGEAIMVLFEEYCEDKIVQPTHIIDYPKESTVFSKVHRQDSELIERFESYVAGKEVSNGYSELNDAVLQRQLLEEQTKLQEAGAEEIWGQVDEEFLAAMDIGMPPAAGIGIGIDRMAMLLLDQASIRDIIFFPTMKPLPRKLDN